MDIYPLLARLAVLTPEEILQAHLFFQRSVALDQYPAYHAAWLAVRADSLASPSSPPWSTVTHLLGSPASPALADALLVEAAGTLPTSPSAGRLALPLLLGLERPTWSADPLLLTEAFCLSAHLPLLEVLATLLPHAAGPSWTESPSALAKKSLLSSASMLPLASLLSPKSAHLCGSYASH